MLSGLCLVPAVWAAVLELLLVPWISWISQDGSTLLNWCLALVGQAFWICHHHEGSHFLHLCILRNRASAMAQAAA